jgi:hypothetical protein
MCLAMGVLGENERTYLGTTSRTSAFKKGEEKQ